MTSQKILRREQRIKKVKRKVFGKPERPRLSIFRSNKRIYAQLIDDSKGTTLTSVSDYEVGDGLSKLEKAEKVGEIIAQKAQKLKVKKVVFDRGRFAYHGRVKALAEGARKGGLAF